MPSTRRHTLQIAGGLVAALAGCNARPDDPPSPTEQSPPSDALTDPANVRLRDVEAGPVVARSAPTPTDEAGHLGKRLLVTDAETADSLWIADVEDADRARSFLTGTEFGDETVYVEQRELGECYTRELCWVRWTESSVETAYLRGYRDSDVACDADATNVVAHLIRLPVALDPDEVRSGGSQTTSGHCRTPREEESA